MTARDTDKPVVGGGGKDGPRGFQFEVTAGALCLDLANTIDNRPTDTPKERLGSYADLVSWGEQAGAIGSAEARRLNTAARRRPAAAAAVLRRTRALREALFAIFAAVVEGDAPRVADIELLNRELGRAMGRARIIRGEGARDLRRRTGATARAGSSAGESAPYSWDWGGAGDDLDRILWPVARSAADLLTDDRLARVRECDAGNCAWLFVDTSRNRSRRWCDMTVCGNREKAQRHYRRTRRSR
jgi:predicted RNA-binding Zn ribbon-like protein